MTGLFTAWFLYLETSNFYIYNQFAMQVTTAEGEGLESASMTLQGNVGVVLARPAALSFLQVWTFPPD